MQIVVLHGSPKGDISVTMQYVAYIRSAFPEHSYTIINAAHEIKKLENNTQFWESAIDTIRSADLILWSFPLYYLLVPAQYKRFIELLFERDAIESMRGKYAISLSTSIHFFDQTAHSYIRGIAEDFGMNYLGGYSAEMYDLVEEDEQTHLKQFISLVFSDIENKVRVQRETAPLQYTPCQYIPDTPGPSHHLIQTEKKVVILTDDDGKNPNLSGMNTRLSTLFAHPVQIVNLRDLDIKGGCLGCCRCGYDNTCIYQDGYAEFFTSTLKPADIIIISGTIRDRYLSSVWKQFFDRSFFNGHIPALKGKQVGFLISGPLRQIPSLKEVLTGWADNNGCHAHFLTDEVLDSGELDVLLDSFARRLVQGADAGYIPPPTFYAVGGQKIFRDSVYGGMRFIFQADYRYYREHGLFDFPQGDIRTRLMNLVMMAGTTIPAVRKRVFDEIKPQMIAPLRKVLSKE